MSQEFFSPSRQCAVFFVSSDEPLLMRDFLDATRKAFRSAAFEDIQNYYVDQGFDWSAIEGESNLSLFSTLTLKVFQFQSNKPGVAGAKGITALCEQANEEDVVVISMPKLEAKTKNSAWFKKLKQVANVVELAPIYANKLVHWISARAQSKGLHLVNDTVRFLADRTEGNLLAADQELEKLLLLNHQGETLTLDIVATSVANHARFSHYELADSCLLGDTRRAVKILKNQQSEGVANLTLLNALKTNIDIVSRIKHVLHDAQKLAKVWLQLRVWDSKKSLYLKAANRLDLARINELIQLCAKIDRIEKGQASHHPNYIKIKPISSDIQGLEMLELVNKFSGT